VPEVIDAWYDSGAMPFAQWATRTEQGAVRAQYPAQFICEAIDQTRGWFYTLMAIGTLVFDRSSYENVVCLGHILAEDGRKMSKHLGNILEPIPLMDQHGADAVRWFMAAGLAVVGPPGRAHRAAGGRPQDPADLLEHGRLPGPVRPHRRLDAVGGRPGAGRPAGAGPLGAVRAAPAGPGPTRRWRRSTPRSRQAARGVRRRPVQLVRAPQPPPVLARRPGRAGHPARGAETVTRLMAPLTPFITERVWQDMVVPVDAGRRPESVHLAAYPVGRRGLIDPALSEQMALARRLVELGRAARAESGMKTRQPLSRALASADGLRRSPRSCSPRSRRAERRAGRRGRRGSFAGRHHRQGQLPRARQAVRQGGAGGRQGDRRRRRGRPSRAAGNGTATVRSTASRSRSARTR
jgi:isoleucyl-tRNA synthetase